MKLTTTTTAIRVSLTVEEASAVRDDLGGIRASEISAAGDYLHEILGEALSESGESR